MEYKKCCLYGMKSKKRLFELLGIKDKEFRKQNYIVSKITPFLVNDKRLAEAPNPQLKEYQRRVLRKLQQMDFPKNVFSGVKGKSYIDNSRQHKNNDNMFVIDISKFFPSISRDRVYKFFKQKLAMSPDAAEILTNFATIDLDRKKQNKKNIIKVNEFLENKKIKVRNHLATGSPFSPLLSYLVNIDLFDELQLFSDACGLTMTIYIDDVAFTSNGIISNLMRETILNIVEKHHYNVNKEKCRYYGKDNNKRLTGGIITKNKKIMPQNKLLFKLQDGIKIILEKEPSEITKKEIQNIRGTLSAIQMTDKQMPNLSAEIKKIEKYLRTTNKK